jgi:hypothetical protein
MEKFLSIPVTNKGNKLVSLSGVKVITQAAQSATALTTLIAYQDGTVTTITHDAAAAFDMRIALEQAMEKALQSDWKKVVHPFTSPKAVSSILNA